MILALEITPNCSASNGAVIIFERENSLIPGMGPDVGHVGVAFKNPNDGTWIGGAVEATGDTSTNIWGVDPDQYNGGWYSDTGFFRTQEDVIREFSTNRITESNGIIPHDAYDKMKFIAVQNPHYDEALREIQRFPGRGFRVWANNDCLNGVYDVMNAYNVEGLSAPRLTNWPKSYYNNLLGIDLELRHKQQYDASPSSSNSDVPSRVYTPPKPSYSYIEDQTGSTKEYATDWWDSISAWISAWVDMIQKRLPLTPERLLYTAGIIVVLLLGISLIWRSLRDFIINGVSGLLLLYLSSTYIGIGVTVNALTLLVCAIGGVPGAILILALKHFYGITI